ncbi:flagellar hook-basal body complex protein [Clostridium sp.]|uniref:flagellar hook-basal body complex protein n=1 Tax=Clostridium sp. TaxID=1506 RepID=UPI00284FBB87|nr:flagellar hook-basal body complex protein [Clostridium sp.]MDR3594026.1 flagellar hook-basal body complex protein [Clostridium sp.]
MLNIFATAKSGMSAYQEKLDYLSNDLANTDTIGYKSTDIGFKDLLSESLDRNGTPLVNKTAVSGTGVKLGEDYATNSEGNIKTTGKQTDLDINGDGYFALTQSDGSIVYTRDGNFQIDSNGTLASSNGDKVYIQYENGFSEGNPELKSDNISIDSNGGITVKNGGQDVKIGTIPIFTAIGDKSFIHIGNNCFTPSSGAQVTLSNNYSIIQGALEGSNVNTTDVFSDLIVTQRAFQLNSKAMTVADDLWSMVNSMRS